MADQAFEASTTGRWPSSRARPARGSRAGRGSRSPSWRCRRPRGGAPAWRARRCACLERRVGRHSGRSRVRSRSSAVSCTSLVAVHGQTSAEVGNTNGASFTRSRSTSGGQGRSAAGPGARRPPRATPITARRITSMVMAPHVRQQRERLADRPGARCPSAATSVITVTSRAMESPWKGPLRRRRWRRCTSSSVHEHGRRARAPGPRNGALASPAWQHRQSSPWKTVRMSSGSTR